MKKAGLKQTKDPTLIKSDIKLTIGMLVSNRIKYIRKAMEALKPLLDAVPSELIIIDTKGEETDGSIAICREYTDKIFSFTWCNDFSTARNACLEHARGEWFMYQDDDEWFDNVQEFIDFFNSGECEKYFSGYYYTKDYDVLGNTSFGIAGRMIRRYDNTHFVGKVHEGFNEVFGPCKQFQSFTHHMGYVYFTPEEKKQHQERNLSLLKIELREKGYTPRICAQIVQELMVVEDTAKEGLDFAQKSIEEISKCRCWSDAMSQWILMSTVRYYVTCGTYEQVKAQAELIRSWYELSRMADLVVSYVVILAAVEEKDTENVLENVNRYIQNWDWLQANPEEALQQTQLDFPKYYTKECFYDVLFEGAKAENMQGNYKAAMTYWNRMPWKDDDFNGSRYFEELQVTQNGYKELLEKKQQEKKYAELKALYSVLYEVEPVVRQYLLNDKRNEATELLTGMQETVIIIGNTLEELLDEGTEYIHVLEHCCELIWQCANAEKEASLRLLSAFFEDLKKAENML